MKTETLKINGKCFLLTILGDPQSVRFGVQVGATVYAHKERWPVRGKIGPKGRAMMAKITARGEINPEHWFVYCDNCPEAMS